MKHFFLGETLEPKFGFKDVMVVPKLAKSPFRSRSEVQLECDFRKTRGLPIVASNMDTVGTFRMAGALARHKIYTAVHRYYSLEQWKCFITENRGKDILPYVWYTIGPNRTDLGVVDAIYDYTKGEFPNLLMIDAANGYSAAMYDAVKMARERFPNTCIGAGNVITPEATIALHNAGADVIKIGIGSGSACTTRKKTGIGFPQLSCLMECRTGINSTFPMAARPFLMSDGGCIFPGDIVKALVAGANCVMLGGMLAGHDECIEINDYNIKLAKIPFRGMASRAAIEHNAGGLRDYRTEEGKEVEIPNRGPIDNTVQDILGGLRSACTYLGTHLSAIQYEAKFVHVNEQTNDIFGK